MCGGCLFHIRNYLLPYFIDAQLHVIYLLFPRYTFNGSLILIHHLFFIWRSPLWFPRYRVEPVRLVSLSANMLRPLRHSKIKKIFERKVTYVVFTLPDTDRIGLYCYVKNSGPIAIPTHVLITMQMTIAPNLVLIRWNLTNFHSNFA